MNPIYSWILGIQCVAMNVQTFDEATDLVNALFRINGNCGYVLKPKSLLEGQNPNQLIHEKVRMRLKVTVICGQYLPNPKLDNDIIDPYVVIQMFGLPSDMKLFKTQAINNNGFNPVWNETFTFELKCPELAILRMTVIDYDMTSRDDFVGEFSVPVTSIRQGYSLIRLRIGPERQEDDAASILVKITYEEYANSSATKL
uniref:Phosphoinositide phospholipase C n=1 Tax=Acrobeloides nanus TaxID=290746 RepID=A0A914ELS7_9BILA